MGETSQKVIECRAALTDLLRACEQFEEQFGWSGTRAYVRSSDEKQFDEAREAAARIAAPVAGEVPDVTRDHLRTLLRACSEFTARFSDDMGKAYIDKDDEERWKAARREAGMFLRQR